MCAKFSDDEWFDFFNKFDASEQKITYGTNDSAEVKIVWRKALQKRQRSKNHHRQQCRTRSCNELARKIQCLQYDRSDFCTYLLGISLEDIQEGVANLEEISGRFERAVENLPSK